MKILIKNNILIFKQLGKSPSLEEIKELKINYENSVGKNYPYVLFTNILGYFSGYDFETNRSIYCGCLSESQAIQSMLEYINDSNDD